MTKTGRNDALILDCAVAKDDEERTARAAARARHGPGLSETTPRGVAQESVKRANETLELTTAKGKAQEATARVDWNKETAEIT
jgi:methionyl-tRNA formyltransferase